MKSSICFFLAVLVLVANPGQAQEVALTDHKVLTIQDQVLQPFFEALKTGDVSSIKKHLSHDLYASNRVLLDENRDYPAFLRNYYQNINFRVVKAEEYLSGEGIIFQVAFDHGDGNSSNHELILSREKHGDLKSDVWVIEKF